MTLSNRSELRRAIDETIADMPKGAEPFGAIVYALGGDGRTIISRVVGNPEYLHLTALCAKLSDVAMEIAIELMALSRD